MRAVPLVLLAENNPLVRNTLSMVLSRSGYEVAETADSHETVALASDRRPDLLLVNMQLGPTNGLEVLRAIRGQPETATMPVIVLAASSKRDDVLAAARAGANYFIARNTFNTRDFLSRVAGFVGQKHVPAEADDRAEPVAAPPARPTGLPVTRACFLRDAAASSDINKHNPPIKAADLNDWAGKITQVRALPFVIPRVLALTASQYSSADALVEAVGQDTALTGKVLAVANSSLYSRGREPTTSLRQAVRNIGFSSVRQAALGLGLLDLFEQSGLPNGIDRLSFWEHSFASASIAALLAARAGMDQSQAFIVALLHGLGELIFDDFLPEEHTRMLAMCNGEKPLPADIERRWMGVEHAHLAQIVLHAWRMPESLYEPIGDHRLPLSALLNKPERRRHAGLLKLADMLAACLGFGDARVSTVGHLDNEFVDPFGVDDQFLNEVRTAIPDQLRELKMAMLLYLPKSGLARKAMTVSSRPVLYLCPRPPHVDIVQYYLRLRHSHVEAFTGAEAFLLRLQRAEPDTQAVVNLLPAAMTDRTIGLLDQWLAGHGRSVDRLRGLLLVRPDQAEKLDGPAGRAFDGLLCPTPACRLERLLGR